MVQVRTIWRLMILGREIRTGLDPNAKTEWFAFGGIVYRESTCDLISEAVADLKRKYEMSVQCLACEIPGKTPWRARLTLNLMGDIPITKNQLNIAHLLIHTHIHSLQFHVIPCNW